ncbi:MAG: hypothetical protein J3R72DRAFT_526348 [Linnemannia gamsii]|nr:MAG: hypothetical protein J3R72DRAFT_526348 [Linnemannia gamsii]
MRFSTIIAAASALVLLGTVSAQSPPPMPNNDHMAACGTCLNEALYDAAPVCKGIDSKTNPNAPPTEKQLVCFCSLVAKKDWGNSCVQPDKCSALMVSNMQQAMVLAASQPGTCDKVSITSAAAVGGMGGSSSKMALVAAGASMFIAGAVF